MREPFIAGPPRGRGLRDLSLFSDSRVRRQVKAQETCAPVVGFRQRRGTSTGACTYVRMRVREASGGYMERGAGGYVGGYEERGVRASTATRAAHERRVPRVTSPHTGPVTRGTLCGKGRFGRQRVQNRG
ncbi:hypothetical protein [Streptomyces sp. BBFR115]|uniref:hypothetical protein n=1 Tax=Streptomyces sp. BBFR115 TaxID=3448173 RepID=UPI003F762C4F